jgi:hypothetical protein
MENRVSRRSGLLLLPCHALTNATQREKGGASSSFASPCTHVHSFSLILYIYLQQEHLDIPEASRLFGLGSTPPCALMYVFMGYLFSWDIYMEQQRNST